MKWYSLGGDFAANLGDNAGEARSCAQCLIREEQLQNLGKLIQPANADLSWAKRHACAVALIKHPVREFAAMATPLLRKDALQVFAAP